MSVAMRTFGMTREQFLAWAETQEGRWEFDGFAPVAMTGGTVDHNRIGRNLRSALGNRMRGSPCEPLGPDAGIATIGDAVRYPDALVTCSRAPGNAYLVPNPVIVFEVLSPSNSRTDRIDKLREYQAVPSIRRYVIVESTSMGLTVLARDSGDAVWTAAALTAEDTLQLPEIGIEIPMAELYEGVDVLKAPAERSDRRPA